MTGTRVDSSPTYYVYVLFLWLILPTGWTTLIAVGGLLLGAEGGAGVFAVISVPFWWLAWRFVGRSVSRLPEGLRIRGFRRTVVVPWHQVLAVDATELEGQGRSVSFSRVVVTFHDPRTGLPMTRTVASSFRSASVGRNTVLSWFPPDHPLHRPLTVAVPYPSAPDTLPLMATLPQSTAMKAILLVLAGLLGAGSATAAVLCLLRLGDGPGWVAGAALSVLLVATSVRFTVRTWRARLDLTAGGLVNHGFFHTYRTTVPEIEGFRLVPSGAGGAVRIVLVGKGSRSLAAGAGFGTYPEHTLRQLEHWHATVRQQA
jgi:hypothetical protein